MTTEIYAKYRSLRLKHPRLPASQAVLWARSTPRYTFEWEDDRSGGQVARLEVDGLDIVVRAKDDMYPPEPEYTLSDDPLDGGLQTELRADHRYSEMYHPEIRALRYLYVALNDPLFLHNILTPVRRYHPETRKWWLPMSGYTLPKLAAEYHDAGMSRAVAYETARASLREEMAIDLEVSGLLRNGYSDYSYMIYTAEVVVAGETLGSSSIGSGPVSWEDWEEDASTTIDEYGLIEEAIADARESLPDAIRSLQERVLRYRTIDLGESA